MSDDREVLGRPQWFTWYQVRRMIWKVMAFLPLAFMVIAGVVMGQTWDEAPLWKRLAVVVGFILVGLTLCLFVLWYIGHAGV